MFCFPCFSVLNEMNNLNYLSILNDKNNKSLTNPLGLPLILALEIEINYEFFSMNENRKARGSGELLI